MTYGNEYPTKEELEGTLTPSSSAMHSKRPKTTRADAVGSWRDRLDIQVLLLQLKVRHIWKEWLPREIAWRLPEKVAYWAIVRAFSLVWAESKSLTPDQIAAVDILIAMDPNGDAAATRRRRARDARDNKRRWRWATGIYRTPFHKLIGIPSPVLWASGGKLKPKLKRKAGR